MTAKTLPVRLEAVIFDWAGTLVDFGSFAPTKVFVDAFAQFGVEMSLEVARGPMGMGKWDHIRTLCDLPAIASQYEARFGRLPTDDDVTAIYERFLPMQLEKVAQYSAAIPGAAEQLRALRQRGLKIGSCSGYPASVMRRVIERAATEGWSRMHRRQRRGAARASRAGHGAEERDRAGPVRRGRLRQVDDTAPASRKAAAPVCGRWACCCPATPPA